MDRFCINHPEEKAVGTCGGCGSPTCYRCSMNVDQVVYCSLACFNQLNPPSSPGMLKAGGAAVPPPTPPAALADEYSDVMQAMVPAPAPAPASTASAPVSLEDPSVVLSAAQADEASTMMMKKYRNPATGEDSTLVLIPGTRRSVLSSSCFFHPDTSAIVLCSECRNPICSLCARETAGGLACSPSCGPADPAREIDRKKDLLFSFALAGGVLLVLAGALMILRSAARAQSPRALAQEIRAEDSVDSPASDRPARLPAPAPAPEPAPVEVPAPAPLPEPAASAPPSSFRPVLPPRPAPVVTAPPEEEPLTLDPLPASPARPSSVTPLRPLLAPPPRPAPEPPRLSPYDLDLRWASALLGDATPLVREVSLTLGPDWRPGPDVPALSSKLNRAVVKLRQARELYARHIAEAPDRAMLEDRIASIGETLKAAQEGFDRMGGVPQWRH